MCVSGVTFFPALSRLSMEEGFSLLPTGAVWAEVGLEINCGVILEGFFQVLNT